MTQTVTGAPFWTGAAQVPVQYPYLTEDIDCDVVVVGGGLTGALCAYYLQKAGVDTVLLDSGMLGYGSTSISPSFIQYEINYGLSELRELIGIERAARVFGACATAVDDIDKIVRDLGADVGFARRDCLFYTSDATGNKMVREEYLLRRRSHFPVELLDSNECIDKFSFPIGSGIYTTGLGGEIDPYRFTHELVKHSVGNGLRVYENTFVEAVTSDNTGICLQTKNRYSVKAMKMVNATGISATKDAGNLASMRTSFCVITEPVSDFQGWYNRCIIRDDDDPYTYLHTTSDNRILIGGLDSALIDGRGTFAGLIKIPAAVEKKYTCLEQKLVSMFPKIEGIRAQYRFAGIYGDTCDGLPYIGECSKFPNVYFDICCMANGIVFADIGAKIISEQFLGLCPQDTDLFSFDR